MATKPSNREPALVWLCNACGKLECKCEAGAGKYYHSSGEGTTYYPSDASEKPKAWVRHMDPWIIHGEHPDHITRIEELKGDIWVITAATEHGAHLSSREIGRFFKDYALDCMELETDGYAAALRDYERANRQSP